MYIYFFSSRGMICVEQAARMSRREKYIKVLLKKPEGKSALGKPSRRYGNITADLS